MEPLPPILRLPDEILHQILSSACLDKPRRRHRGRLWEYKKPSTVKNIALTCSSFRRISRPFLYESVYIQQAPVRSRCTTSGLSPSGKAIHARFRDDPSLRPHCRKLQVWFHTISKNDYALVKDLLGWLTNVRYLSMSGIFTHPPPKHGVEYANDLSFRYDMWALIRMVSLHMRRLEVLRCADHWRNCSRGSDLIQNINIPSLRRLEFGGLASTGEFLVSNEKRTAPFTSLRLGIFSETPDVISRIISWPQTLTEICFDKPWNEDVYRIDIHMVQSWLQIHKATLKRIRIDELAYGRLPWQVTHGLGFNAANFPNLEHLQLSRWLWDAPLDEAIAKVDADLLLGAPKLRVFVWDFTKPYDTCRERWTDFNAREEEWLRCFAQVAVTARQEGRCCLEEIRLRFTPEEVGMSVGEDEEEELDEKDEVYPWDRMDRVREEVLRQSEGLLQVEYNQPVFDRDSWKRDLELHKEWRRKMEREGGRIPRRMLR